MHSKSSSNRIVTRGVFMGKERAFIKSTINSKMKRIVSIEVYGHVGHHCYQNIICFLTQIVLTNWQNRIEMVGMLMMWMKKS